MFNNNNKTLIILGIVALIIIAVLIYLIINKDKTTEMINNNKYMHSFKENLPCFKNMSMKNTEEPRESIPSKEELHSILDTIESKTRDVALPDSLNKKKKLKKAVAKAVAKTVAKPVAKPVAIIPPVSEEEDLPPLEDITTDLDNSIVKEFTSNIDTKLETISEN